MKRAIFISTAIVFIVISTPADAQQEDGNSSGKVEFAELNPEQKVDVAVRNLSATMLLGIEYAKMHGQTPFEYGKFLGSRFAPTWEEHKGKGVTYFVEDLHKVFQTSKAFDMEVMKQAEDLVTFRMKRVFYPYMESYPDAELTREEYDRFLNGLMQEITGYLGFETNNQKDGDWLVYTISR